MKNIMVMAIFFAALLQSAVVHAEEDEFKNWRSPYTPYEWGNEDCESSNRSMTLCMSKSVTHSEAFLKKLIKENVGALSEEQIMPFHKANQLWEQFRNASCEFDTADMGGSSKPLFYLTCKNDFNEARIEKLSKYFYCLKSSDCGNGSFLYFLTK